MDNDEKNEIINAFYNAVGIYGLSKVKYKAPTPFGECGYFTLYFNGPDVEAEYITDSLEQMADDYDLEGPHWQDCDYLEINAHWDTYD